jgi:uncharacterized protein YkwD
MIKLWHRLKGYFVPAPSNAYRPHLLRSRWLLFFLAITLATEAFLVSSLVVRQSPDNFISAVIAADIVRYTNEKRSSLQERTLQENELLQAAAQKKAEDMAARGYFSHEGPDGKSPWQWFDEGGYDYRYAGENLAVRFVDSKDVVEAWMASPSHKANIVKGVYTEIGIGVAQGTYRGSPATFVVQFFGAPPGGGAAAVTSKAPSFSETIARYTAQLVSEPRSSSVWVFSAVATLLLVLLLFAFFVRLHIQASDMLAPGAVVAAVALLLMGANSAFLSDTTDSSQSAAAGYALPIADVVVTDIAATTQR